MCPEKKPISNRCCESLFICRIFSLFLVQCILGLKQDCLKKEPSDGLEQLNKPGTANVGASLEVQKEQSVLNM